MAQCKCGATHFNNITTCDVCLENEAVRVGTVTVSEAFDCHAGFESAAAYHVIRVEPGEYPILVKVSRFDGRRYIAIPFTGKVTASGYGAKRYDDKIGTVDTVTRCPGKYAFRGGHLAHYGSVTITDEATLETAYE